LVAIESRLNRCLADGWRNSESDRPMVSADAEELTALGLPEFAGRLRAVADAASPREALDAITFALASSRQLRARLATSDRPEIRWTPWLVPRKSRTERETIWPLCRFSLGETVVWSCLRSRGYPVEWTLIEESDEIREASWFGQPLTGHLHWQGRYPIGASREVQVSTFRTLGKEADGAPGPDVYLAFRKRLAAGKLRDDKLPAWGGGSIRLTTLEREHVDNCHWPDPVVQVDYSALLSEQCWSIVWDPGDLRVVIGAIVERGRLFKKLHVIHLCPGCPSVELVNLA
jgi:hypothetical protein